MTSAEFRLIRHHQGWSQAHLARLLGCQPLAVTRWETGTRHISDTISLIMRVLDTVPAARQMAEELAKK